MGTTALTLLRMRGVKTKSVPDFENFDEDSDGISMKNLRFQMEFH